METTAAILRLSLPDIALLTKVQRPVVSMWRSRSRGSHLPFPEATGLSAGQELFDADDVVTWLQATGRGNNPQATEDAAAFSITGREHSETLTALLVIRALSGQPLTGLAAEDVLDLAEELDSDDDFVFRELEGEVGSLEPLIRYCDLLVDAAFSPVEAFEKLMSDRFRSGSTGRMISGDAVDLVALTALALAGEERFFAEATPGGSDLLRAITEKLGESDTATLRPGTGATPLSRLALRRLRIHAFATENLQVSAPGSTHPGLVTVAHFPAPGATGLTDRQLMTAIDEISLAMDGSETAVILAPARLLSDALPNGEAARIRDTLLRSDRVRSVVRLPVGLLTSSPRQHLALWVMGTAHTDAPIAERRTMVADLSATTLDESTRQDLVGDLVASMTGRETIHARAFRFARLVPTRLLLAGDGDLCHNVNPGSGVSSGRTSGAALLVTAERVLEVLDTEHVPESFDFALEPSEAAPRHRAQLGELLADKALQLIAGSRLLGADIGHEDGFRVIGISELRNVKGARSIDRLLLASRYPRARLTDPGDIIFSTIGLPAAMVDTEGLSVVEFPARILRINPRSPTGLVASSIVSDINGNQGGPWRRWIVKRFPQEHVNGIRLALDTISLQRKATLDRLNRLDQLAALLTEGSSLGTLHITDQTSSLEGTS